MPQAQLMMTLWMGILLLTRVSHVTHAGLELLLLLPSPSLWL